MSENRASERLPIACEPHKYRSGEGLPTRSFCEAQYVHVLRTLRVGLGHGSQKLPDICARLRSSPLYLASTVK